MQSPVLCSEIARKHGTRVELGGSDQCANALTFGTTIMLACRFDTARCFHPSLVFKDKARRYM